MKDEIAFEVRKFGGVRDGPRLLITAGVHGDEFLPMLAVKELARRFESDDVLPSSLNGTLTLVPVVNRPAFRRGHRCGDDGLDLARTCPGVREGSPTEQIAFALSENIRRHDYYVDLHTGGTELSVFPLAGYVLHPNAKILENQRAMARAFQLPFIWGTSADLPGRSLSVARDAKVPAIYVEYFGAHRELAEVASMEVRPGEEDHPLVAGCLNILRHLGMLEGLESTDCEQRIVEDPGPGSGHMQVAHPAPTTGFLVPKVRLGQEVQCGDVLVEIIPEKGSGKAIKVRSRQSGIVVVLRDYPRVNEGEATAAVAEER